MEFAESREIFFYAVEATNVCQIELKTARTWPKSHLLVCPHYKNNLRHRVPSKVFKSKKLFVSLDDSRMVSWRCMIPKKVLGYLFHKLEIGRERKTIFRCTLLVWGLQVRARHLDRLLQILGRVNCASFKAVDVAIRIKPRRLHKCAFDLFHNAPVSDNNACNHVRNESLKKWYPAVSQPGYVSSTSMKDVCARHRTIGSVLLWPAGKTSLATNDQMRFP